MSTSSTNTSSAGKGNNGGSAYIATQSIFVAIATLVVFVRIYVRSFVVKKFGIDDAAVVLALVSILVTQTQAYTDRDQILSLVVCAMTSLTVHYSTLYLDHHFRTKAEAIYDVTAALKWSSIAAPIGIFSGLFTRLSICLFLLRIFGTKSHWRKSLYAIMVFVTAVVIPTVVSLLAQCSPTKKLWNKTLPGHCWSPQTVIDIGYWNGGE